MAVDSNYYFPDIENIKAQEKAAALEAKEKAGYWQTEAQKASEAIQKTTLESVLFEWQIDL